MEQIISKYASKEQELSARLLKKYGQGLAHAIPAETLRQIFVQFDMEDRDRDYPANAGGDTARDGSSEAKEADAVLANKCAPDTAASSGASAAAVADAALPTPEAIVGRENEANGRAEQTPHSLPPKGSALDFRSRFFDPLQVCALWLTIATAASPLGSPNNLANTYASLLQIIQLNHVSLHT